jgi:UPF0755 protein
MSESMEPEPAPAEPSAQVDETPPTPRLKRRLLIFVPAALVLAAIVSVWLLWVGPGPAARETTLIVAEGSSVSRVADQLAEAGLIRGGAGSFRLFARVLGSGDPIQAGEFVIPRGASAAGILDQLQHGRPVVRTVVVPEGLPSVLVRDRLLAARFLTGDVAVPAEGSVLPGGYTYRRGETRAAVLGRMQRAMRTELARLWAARRPGIAVATPEQAIILASIVEKETGKPAERRLVAGVYSNRLRQNMPLQADPTVIYPVTQGRPLGRRILASELRARNGYNTYAMRGLPQGPIANPGRDSIAAVLDPQPTSHLYFVADGTGGHVFATTLAEHEANVTRWRALRRARGEIP